MDYEAMWKLAAQSYNESRQIEIALEHAGADEQTRWNAAQITQGKKESMDYYLNQMALS